MLRRTSLLAAAIAVAVCNVSLGAGLTDSLKKGTPALKSAGPLAFGPEGILFVGDPAAAMIYAIGTGDTKPAGKGDVKLDKVDDQIASLVGTMSGDITIADMKVNPASGNVYFSVARGKGASAMPLIVKFDRSGKPSQLELKDIPFASVTLPNPSAGNAKSPRSDVITSMAFVKGQLIVAGMSNEEFASKLRTISFPFKEADKGASIEIYHGAHGALETRAPVRTFTTLDINGETNVLASYQCTPLVKIPVSDLKPGDKVKGTTVAELGNRNRPLDMIVYKKDGKNYLLMANNARGVMKVNLESVDKITPVTTKVADKAGLTYESLPELKDVVHLDKLDDDRAILLAKSGSNYNVSTIPLP
jgi:hypothetical protein